MDSPWLDDSQYAVWRQWLRVQTEFPAAMNRQLQRDSGMSGQDFEILVRLSEAPEEHMRIGALAEDAAWERSRLSHHLRRMESRGLVRRESCADDGRGSLVRLTDAGRLALENAAPGHARLVKSLMFAGLDDTELALLSRLTTRMLERIAALGDTPTSQVAPGRTQSDAT